MRVRSRSPRDSELPECGWDNLVLANFRRSPSRAQNRARDVTACYLRLAVRSDQALHGTARSLTSQGFAPLNLIAQVVKREGKVKLKIVPRWLALQDLQIQTWRPKPC